MSIHLQQSIQEIRAQDERIWKPRVRDKFGKQVTVALDERWENLYQRLYQEIFLNKDYSLSTSLLKAAELGCENALLEVLQLGVSPDTVDQYKLSALDYAAIKGHHICLDILLEKGADPDIAYGLKPYEFALIHKHDECASLLLKKTKVISLDSFRTVALQHNQERMSFLLKNGFKINTQDPHGWTIIHDLAGRSTLVQESEKVFATLEWLIQQGANIDLPSVDGITPLHVAAGKRDGQMVDYLLSKGAALFPKDRFGNTPLHWALWGGCPEDLSQLELHQWRWKAVIWSLKVAPYTFKAYLCCQKVKSFFSEKIKSS